MNRSAWVMLCAGCLAAIIAARWLPVTENRMIPCLFLTYTGWPCPFCGSTRAFVAMGHGLWQQAIRQSPLGAALFPATILVAMWSGWKAWHTPRGHTTPVRLSPWVWIIGLIALAANWIYRLAEGLK